MGSRDYAMRVWLNPNRLAAYNMVPQDVTEAIRNQNIEAAPGKTGISSDKLPPNNCNMYYNIPESSAQQKNMERLY